MKFRILYLFAILAALTGCSKELDEMPSGIGVDEAVVTVGLNTAHTPNATFKDIHLYWFDETDMLYKQDYYSTMEELAMAQMIVPRGSYTIITVMNVGQDFTIPNMRSETSIIDLSSFSKYVKEQETNEPEMLTGTLRHIVETSPELIYIDLEPKSNGIDGTSVELLLTIPTPHLPDFTSLRSSGSPALRATAYIFKKGSTKLFAVKRAMLESTSTEGIYSMNLSLFKGAYDVNLWADYALDETTDYHYITTGPDVVSILPKEQYTANTDTKDAFSQRIQLSVDPENDMRQSVEMHRPLAKYRLVATDVTKYEALRLAKGYPALSDLKVSISYEGFLPCAYSISQSILTDSQKEYAYSSTLTETTAADATVAKDYVLVNGAQSSVSVTILFKDAKGNTVSGVRGVKIAYRAGQLTTVSGNFLTSGLGSGVTINTDWSGDYNVEF